MDVCDPTSGTCDTASGRGTPEFFDECLELNPCGNPNFCTSHHSHESAAEDAAHGHTHQELSPDSTPGARGWPIDDSCDAANCAEHGLVPRDPDDIPSGSMACRRCHSWDYKLKNVRNELKYPQCGVNAEQHGCVDSGEQGCADGRGCKSAPLHLQPSAFRS